MVGFYITWSFNVFIIHLYSYGVVTILWFVIKHLKVCVGYQCCYLSFNDGYRFIDYALPWGQMSFWGATVITNLVSVVPIIDVSIVEWLWGGFSINNATLNWFFSLHCLLPFAIAARVLLHIAELHQEGSNNPLGVHSKDVDK